MHCVVVSSAGPLLKGYIRAGFGGSLKEPASAHEAPEPAPRFWRGSTLEELCFLWF